MTGPSRRSSMTSGRASTVDDRKRYLDHRVEICDRNALVRRVYVGHSVCEVDAAAAAIVEDVRVGRAARQRVARLIAAARERAGCECHDVLFFPEPVALVALAHLGLDLAVGRGRSE